MNNRQSHTTGPKSWLAIGLLSVAFLGQLGGSILADPPAPLHEIPVPGRRSAEEVKKFFKDLSSKDAIFEVIIGEGRLLTLNEDLLKPEDQTGPLIAIGDDSIIGVQFVGLRRLRIIGQKIGVTDLSILTVDNENYSIEVHVVANLDLLKARLMAIFPEAYLNLTHIREHLVVEGEARDTKQVSQIIRTITAYLETAQSYGGSTGSAGKTRDAAPPRSQQPERRTGEEGEEEGGEEGEEEGEPQARAEIIEDSGGSGGRGGRSAQPQVINLIRVPGPQQVLLKVQVAELNRSALRELGVSFLFQDQRSAFGSTIGGALPSGAGGGGGGGGGGGAGGAGGAVAFGGLLGLLDPVQGGAGTAFAILNGGKLSFLLNALRNNDVLKILAEPNLVAMHGQEATFLSGGEFPVPVPQTSGGGGGGGNLITIQQQQFGVSLTFVPYILDDDVIRLSVAPEVSSIDFSTGVVIQGTAVPGTRTRRTSTVVELRDGQTLAVSGILQVEIQAGTIRIPGLGDLPYIGAMFSNNTTRTIEKELVILVTPYLIQPMNADQVPALPGEDFREADDWEFYLKGRIEGRDHRQFRATSSWDDPLEVDYRYDLEQQYVIGPYGYTSY